MLNFFKKGSSKKIEIHKPIKGELLDISQVPDKVFAGKMVGDGVAIKPMEGKVTSPVDGEIIQIFPTKHAIGIKADNGIEILIHIGIDTVNLEGESFENHVSAGDRVKIGDVLLTFDLEKIEQKAKSAITPIIIANMEEIASIQKGQDEIIMTVVKK